MNFDLAQLVRDALSALGCDPSIGDSIDGHSTITLDFDDLPSLLISVQDEHVWLWCRVGPYSEAMLAHQASAVLSVLMLADDTILGGHPSLTQVDGELEMRAILTPRCLESGELLGEALTRFFDRLTAMTQVTRQ